MYAQHERIPMKDFSAEVRATLDVGNFVNRATLLLDINQTSLESIVTLLLAKMLAGDERSDMIMKEGRAALMTHDSVHVLSKTVQGTSTSEGGGFDYDQSWICALCSLPSLQRRKVAIARLKHPANLGRTSQEIRFFILVLAPMREKGTKNALETARTFATLLADIECRQKLLEVKTEEEFKQMLHQHAKDLAIQQSYPPRHSRTSRPSVGPFDNFNEGGSSHKCCIGQGLTSDLKRRLPHYWSDFRDGVIGHKTLQKVISTTLFLYFACILPSIAFGVLNDKNTHGLIDVKKVIISQTMCGIFFSLFGGQPLIVMLTTAPLALYIKILYTICEDLELDFYSMYALVGIWNSVFLLIYSFTDASKLMKWSTRSTEEIFSLFVSIAFCVDAFKDLAAEFDKHYHASECTGVPAAGDLLISTQPSMTTLNDSNTDPTTTLFSNISSQISTTLASSSTPECHRDSSILYLLLMLGTLWLGVTLYNFTKSPFLDASKREALADYALPVAVLIMSFVGSYVFRGTEADIFSYNDGEVLNVTKFEGISIGMVAGSMGLGFCLSLLFFMDQNISSALVNNPANKLKKGTAYHLDLFVVAIMNCFVSIFGLPWVHAALPHSPLHVRALADVEERVDQGHVYHIVVRVRETRLTTLFSHIMIGLSIMMLPTPLQYIPKAVLYGLFLYIAYTALDGNQLFERIVLLITEQAAYPPNHYVRRVPQRKMHLFTAVQLLQLGILCGFGFSPWPYLKMVFPLLILTFLPIRHKLVPFLIDLKFLDALDRSH
ncbi:sodium bicarbonate transporter-like protein 11 isoform X2 [Lytechinus variegatus]|uniref:sodium bicarbonate transporter-like protein 11 isoform X2 n=1 Tax=Lytechinus variegatus TaxID=7654 RepID=UPI001BB26B46|nr:sodium bicarbonate transporter-like protein 11 isoform X2 [Lytechinus variegatus]